MNVFEVFAKLGPFVNCESKWKMAAKAAIVVVCSLICVNTLFFGVYAFISLSFVFVLSFVFFKATLLKYKTLPSFIKSDSTFKRTIFDKNYVCLVCDENECEKHQQKVYLNPWNCIEIDVEVNEALESVLNYYLDEFVGRRIKNSEEFVEELRKVIKFTLSSFLKRVLSLNLNELILREWLSLFVNHFQMFVEGKRKAKSAMFLEEVVLNEYKNEIHPSVKSVKEETKWLGEWCDYAIPLLVPPKCAPLFHVFVKEFLVFDIFHPLIELITDPYNINSFVISYFESDTSEKLSKKNETQQFLKSFVKFDKQNSENVLGIKMKEIINDEKLLFLFMKYLKSEGVVNLLQFILTLNNLNEKMYSPNFNDTDWDEVRELMQEAYDQYLSEDGIDRLNLNIEKRVFDFNKLKDKEELQKLNITLFDAYEQVYILLENFYLKHFLESDLYMKLIVGHRKCLLNEEFVGEKRKETKKVVINYDDEDDEEREEEEFVFKELVDLSLFKVNVEEFGRDLFLIRVEDQSDKWKVLRSKRDFNALEEKLRRFHGNNLIEKRRKDDSAENEFQMFLNELISIPKLKCSQLLNNFLKDEEFETKNDLIFNDLINSFRKLIPENRKFDTFIHSFILSTMERKEKNDDEVEEAEEVCEEKSPDEPRFYFNLGDELRHDNGDRTLIKLNSVYEHLIYFLVELNKKRSNVLISFLTHFEPFLKNTVEALTQRKLRQYINEIDFVAILDLLKNRRKEEISDKKRKEVKEKCYKLLSKRFPSFEENIFLIYSIFQNPLLNKQLLYLLFDSFFNSMFINKT